MSSSSRASARNRREDLGRAGNLRRSARSAALLLYSLLLLLPFLSSASRPEVHVDETGFVSAARAAVTSLLHGDLLGPVWTSNDWGDYGWPNPMLGKLLIGASLYASGHGEREDSSDVNQLPRPTVEEVHAARWPGVLLGWGACLLLLAIGWRISPPIGLAASAYAALNDYVVYSCSSAMLEAPLVFFGLSAQLLLLRLKDRLYAGDERGTLRLALATAAAASAALSAKLFGGVVFLFALAFPLALAAGGRLGLAPLPRPRLALMAVLVIALATPAGFYVLNPQYYRHPLQRLRLTLGSWEHGQSPEILGERTVPSLSWSLVYTGSQMFRFMPTSKKPVRALYEPAAARWPTAMGFYERYYAGSWLSLETILVAFAALSIGAARRERGRRAPVSDEEIVLAFALFSSAMIALWLPVAFRRYLLLPFMSTPVLVALGLREIAVPLVSLAVNRASVHRPPS